MRGPYHLALSKADGSLIPVEGSQVIAGPSTLHAHYADRSDLRTAGAVIGIVGTIGGIVMMFESVHDKETCDAFGYCQTQTDVNGALLALVAQRRQTRLTAAIACITALWSVVAVFLVAALRVVVLK